MSHETFFVVTNTATTDWWSYEGPGDAKLLRPGRVVYESKAAAESEALRLAMKNPHDSFAVLEAVATIKAEDGRPKWTPWVDNGHEETSVTILEWVEVKTSAFPAGGTFTGWMPLPPAPGVV